MKEATDDLVVKNKMDSYCDGFLPRSDELAIVIFCNAFEGLEFPIRSAAGSVHADAHTTAATMRPDRGRR